MKESTYRHGHFVWHELMATDGAAAEKFYGELFGWTFKHSDMGEMGIYRVIHNDGRELGGIFQMPSGQGSSHWCGYVSVPDVDAAAKTAEANGGKLMMPPMDIPNAGRCGYMTDPEGATIVVFRDKRGDMAPREMPSLGDFCWDSLATNDGERALAFYGAVVGWTRGKFGDAPGLFFAASNGDVIADVEAPVAGVPSHWATHVVIANLDEARAKAASLGATIIEPHVDVPSVGKMAIILDPWGAVISLFEPQMPS